MSFRRFAAICLAVAGLTLGSPPAVAETSETYRQLSLFGDVFERVRGEYVTEVSDEQLIEAAINGMLSALDPHSGYLNERNFRDMRVQTTGEFGGLGIEITLENGVVKVVSPIDDTPAFRAGLQPNDLITHLDGDPILGMTLTEAMERMRGPVGTTIVLTVRRGPEGEPFDVTITRDKITLRSVRHRLEGDVGYVRVTTFSEKTVSGVQEALEAFRAEKGEDLVGLILDLRNNPGGLLDQAIDLSDLFLDRGEVVSIRGREDEDSQRFNAKQGDEAEGLPIVVLINEGSASASEIVAGALQDHRRAVLMGTRTFGKGSVQTIIPLQGHGAMRLTTSHYYTPAGRSIQATGIEPDIRVLPARLETIEQGRLQREADLRGALPNPDMGTEDGDGENAADGEEARSFDYQLARALDLLRGVRYFEQWAVN